jgi:hypothetical protein
MKVLTISALAGLAFSLPAVANAQSDNSAALASDARYCAALVQNYASAHQGATVLPDGSSDPSLFCEANPTGAVASITTRMRDENMPIPPRP